MTKLLVLGCFVLGDVWGCSCVASGTTCDVFKSTEIVFVARVIRDSGEGWGTGPARVVVEEILHGLAADTKELEIPTASGTSCYRRLAKDERYVIFTGMYQGKIAGVDGCGRTFGVRGNEGLLAALREVEKGGKSTLLGYVQRMKGAYDSERGPAGVRVVATRNGRSVETFTGAAGQFEFRDVEPGTYEVRIASPGWIPDQESYRKVDPAIVGAHACQQRTLYAWPDGQISGVVRAHDGNPVAKVKVQAFDFEPRGELASRPVHEAETDATGAYTIHGLAPGRYVIGVNGEKYDDLSPYRPVFYGGSGTRENAGEIQLEDLGAKTGIDLTLSEPRKPATVIIEAVDEEGTPMEFSTVGLYDARGQQRGFQSAGDKQTSVMRLMVFQGEIRTVKISHFIILENPIRARRFEGESGPVEIDAPEVRVRVRMRELAR